jgi:hypothetical protein
MLYRFSSRATAEVIMLGPNGDEVMALLGKPKAEAGVLRWSEAHAAINRLRVEVDAQEAAARLAEKESLESGKTLKLDPNAVSLRQRVQPIVEMLQRAAREEADVTWRV